MEQIKVGDIVRVSEDAPKVYLRGWEEATEYRVYAVAGDAAIITHDRQELAFPTKYLVKVNAEPKEKPSTTIAIPVEANLADSYWQAYEADIAKEIAVKIASPLSYETKVVADYAVAVAKSVVENLKKREE